MHKTRHFFTITKIGPRRASIEHRFVARVGCDARESGRGRGRKKIPSAC
jgi:hypothetical protein